MSRAKDQVAREAPQEMEIAQNMPMPNTERDFGQEIVESCGAVIGGIGQDVLMNH